MPQSAEQRLGRIGMVSAICGTWLVQATIAYRVLRDVFGEEDVEGSPRWCVAGQTSPHLAWEATERAPRAAHSGRRCCSDRFPPRCDGILHP